LPGTRKKHLGLFSVQAAADQRNIEILLRKTRLVFFEAHFVVVCPVRICKVYEIVARDVGGKKSFASFLPRVISEEIVIREKFPFARPRLVVLENPDDSAVFVEILERDGLIDYQNVQGKPGQLDPQNVVESDSGKKKNSCQKRREELEPSSFFLPYSQTRIDFSRCQWPSVLQVESVCQEPLSDEDDLAGK
jgi:hypothetical protein